MTRSVFAPNKIEMGIRLTALLFPFACFSASRPPGPKLLLLDFRLAARELLPKSMVAFSLSLAFRISVCAPIDFRVLRVAGSVAWSDADIFSSGTHEMPP